MFLWICESFKSAKNNRVRKSQRIPYMVNKSQIATFAESPQICGFAELICGPPTYAYEKRYEQGLNFPGSFRELSDRQPPGPRSQEILKQDRSSSISTSSGKKHFQQMSQ
jgi:hypothetical protein